MHPLECMGWDQDSAGLQQKERKRDLNIRLLMRNFKGESKGKVIAKLTNRNTSIYLNSEWVHLVAAFALHLTLNRIHVVWCELSIVRSYMTCLNKYQHVHRDYCYSGFVFNLSHAQKYVTGMHEIRGISNHRSIDSHALMALSPARRTLWLMKATCKPLYPNITGAGHFFRFHSIAHNQIQQK